MRLLTAALGLSLLAAAPSTTTAGPWTFDWYGAVEKDAEGLASDVPKTRVDAVTALLGHDINLTKKHLLKALTTDEDLGVRTAAAKGLGAGGAIEAVPILADWLADMALDPKVRVVAADALGEIGGGEATAALTRSLGDPDASVRQHAVRSLGAIGRRGNPSVVIAIIPRLEDDKAEVKRESIEQLESLGDRRAVIPLVARFSDGAPIIVTAAIRAIGKLGDKSAVPALIRLVGDPREDLKTAAVSALGVLGAIDAIDTLTEQLSVGSETYRAKVAFALGQIAAQPSSGKAGEEAMRMLVTALQAPGASRRGAREGLAIAGRAAVPALVMHLEGRIPGDPTTVVELLAAAPDPRATAALASELERGRVALPTVLKSLGATGDPNALVPMLGALANKDPAIRLAAMDALRPLVGRDARAGDVLIEQLADEDLEIRVLAAEYLGILATPAAMPKLVALAGPGNPTRLRLAAIDGLGQIAATTKAAAASKQLLDVLREGPGELHRAAAVALAYASDAQAIPGLVALAKTDRGPARHEIVRALGSTLRANPADRPGRAALRELAKDASVKTALAAIAGLAAAGQGTNAADNAADRAVLASMADAAASDRQRAAVWALGELRDLASVDILMSSMTPRKDRLISDRLAGDAAWALGEIVTKHKLDTNRLGAITDRWMHGAKFGGWATAINSAGALARTLTNLDAATKTAIVAPRRAQILALAFHKSRLVRINGALALASLDGEDAVKTLSQLAQHDGSPHVRAAAAHALAKHAANPAVKKLLETLADSDPAPATKAVAKAALGGPKPLPARTEWRNFYVVDPTADDAPVRQEQYFVHAADGLVWATYTDARGELASEHLPPGTDQPDVHPGSRESEY